MKTPVIIPAFNEADHIGRVLTRLDHETTEPIVVVNGEEGLEETREVAERYTSHVYTRQEQGKLPAIQYALRLLQQYNDDVLSQPLLFMDADTYPLRGKAWARTMSETAMGSGACSVAGLTLYGDGKPLEVALRNVRRLMLAREDRDGSSLRSAFGANMAINFGGNESLFEEVQDLPHIWPSEDRYLFHLMGGEGERPHFIQLARFGSAAITSARYMPPLATRFAQTPDEMKQMTHALYAARRADGVTHYFDETDGQLYAYDEVA